MSDDSEYTVILSTVPDLEKGAELAKALVEARVAACVNIVPGIRSIYSWEGRIEDESEALLIIKTTKDSARELISMLEKLHPYETPEIIGLPIIDGNKKYMDWIRSATGPYTEE